MNLHLHRAAREELEEAAAWYEQHGTGLGHELLDEIDASLVAIKASPHAWSTVGTTGLRRFVMPRFPYAIIYATEEETLRVYALAHHKRRPGYWTERTFDGEGVG